MSEIKLPKPLLDEIGRGNVVLFLGSGFSYGSIHVDGRNAPIGQELSDLIAEEFLGNEYKGQPLKNVSKFAISETDIFKVQQFVLKIFEPFKPADFHFKLKQFKWKSIYSTNYDFIVERIYDGSGLQKLSPVYRSTKDYIFLNSDNSLPYYKLHGCLSCINDSELPLILTPEQYLTHRHNREMLFNKLFSEAWNYTIVFIGFSFGDEDINAILEEINQKVPGRPRYYLVGPNIKDAEDRYWMTKSITSIKLSFQDFITELEKGIPPNVRQLSAFRPTTTLPIYSKFITDFEQLAPSESFLSFIEKDITYIHRALASDPQDAKSFYKGYFESWAPIINNLDASRELTEAILTEVVISEYYNNEENDQWLFVIKGYAGSGKSVLLKRLAWETGTEYDRFCIFYNKFSKIRYENIVELHRYLKGRIYIFCDDALSHEDELIMLMQNAKKNNIPITIFTTERINTWNSEKNDLKYQAKLEYQLEYLSRGEIDELLSLLEKHKSLGYLEKKSREERVSLLKYKPGYELLVTLYEATHGEPYTKILKDEYYRIDGDKARSLYLTVSILDRLNAPARAGLIARVHEISTNMFRQEMHLPLEYIVFDRYNYRIQDYVYQTRHPYIAELLVETVLTDQSLRFDEYIRILKYLDVDYQNDRIAFAALTNAKKLLGDFSNHEYIKKIFETALVNNDRNAKLLQQYAIFLIEIGEIAQAEKKLHSANQLTNNNDPQIKHTSAEFLYKRAELAKLFGEKNLYLQQAINTCETILKDKKNSSPYPFHTILKCNLYKIELSIEGNDGPSLERSVKDFEKKLAEAKQQFPHQDFILTVEARFQQVFDNRPAALELLEKAHEINPASPYIVSRLVSSLKHLKQDEKIERVILKSLKSLPGDKEINLLYAEFLIENKPQEYDLINHHLKKSYTENDNRHFAQYLHAKSLYLMGDIRQAMDKFSYLRRAAIDPEIKIRVLDFLKEGNQLIQFKGIVKDYFYNHGWIIRNSFNDEIFFHNNGISAPKSTVLKKDTKVIFNIGFTYGGPNAVNISVVE